MSNKQLVLNQYWIRQGFLELKKRIAQHLYNQGLNPEFEKLKAEIQKEIADNGLLLTFVDGRVSNKHPYWN